MKLVFNKGDKIGYLTILEEDLEKKEDYKKRGMGSHTFYKCQCKCGKIISVVAHRLNKENGTRSCGCVHNSKKLDLQGKIFQNLEVLYIDNTKSTGSGKHTYWICKCLKCGNQVSCRSSDLTNGTRKDCGCGNSQRISEGMTRDITGNKYGHLTVLSRDTSFKPKGGQHPKWLVKCDICGKTESTDLRMLEVFGKDRCRNCGKKSYGEQKIAELLIKEGISFVFDKQYGDCCYEDTKHMARFDFRITDKSECDYIIEYDGEQHYNYNLKYHRDKPLEYYQERDRYKDNWCISHGIKIIRIPYTRLKKLCIEDLKLETTQFLVKEGVF